MGKVIVRLSPGLANQMYEYASGLALADKLGYELIADIASCRNSAWGYLLDYFGIRRINKIDYFQCDSERANHEKIDSISKELLNQSELYISPDISADDISKKTVTYNCIDEINIDNAPENIYLCGYFFDRKNYYDAIWKQIKRQYVNVEGFREIDLFREKIRNQESVGIHIRRGDFRFASWALKLEDDYFRAAIQWFRMHYSNPQFYVFSDDIEYAKEILQNDESVKYVHFIGYEDVSLIEFTCLSSCKHHIMSNSSTFSKLADELTAAEDNYCILRDVPQNDSKGFL